MAGFPPRDETMRFDLALNDKYTAKGYPERRGYHTDAEGEAVWLQQYLLYRTQGESHDSAQAHVFRDIDAIWIPHPPVPPGGGTWSPVAPLNGYLRVGPNTSFADDSGPRSVRFCSDFPALRVFRDERDRQLRRLDSMIGRWQGVRVFWHLADPWAPDHLDVSPFWGNFDELFTTFLRECWSRQLRVSLTAGDLQYLPAGTDLAALYRRLAGLCKSVNEQVVAVTGMVNEARVNSHEKDDWPHWARMSTEFQSVHPWGLHGLSDPDGDPEEPASLKAASQSPATLCLKHGTRETWEDAIRRCYNVRYEGHIGKPIDEDEPTNMHGPAPGRIKVYLPLATKAEAFGLHTMSVLTGHLFTFFGDAALTNRQALDTDYGFTQFPQRWADMHIPEDIGTYRLVPGHKADAPITPESFQDPGGSGPDRCDNMVAPDGSRGYAVAYGGSGEWRLRARQQCRGTVWQAESQTDFQTGGARFFTAPASIQTAVVEWHR